MVDPTPPGPMIVGRYALQGELASGGMATIYFGRRTDDKPPGTTVAIKRVHPHLARDKRFSSMFIDEARLLSRIQHPNVIRTVDIIAGENECLLVMEYVHGESLARLLREAEQRRISTPLEVITAIVAGALEGLHAAHDATNAMGVPLLIVHRDISPQNLIVGDDGVARVLDFGVAKAAGSLQVTRDGEMKGKLAYMSPEQVSGRPVDRRTDVYAAGVVLWEAVTQRPLFDGENDAAIIASVLRQEVPVPSSVAPWVPAPLDAVILRALSPDPVDRFPTAAEMAEALDAAIPRASAATVADWVDSLAGDVLRERRDLLSDPNARASRPPPRVGVTEVFFTTKKKKTPSGATPARSSGSEDAIALEDDDLEEQRDDGDGELTRVHGQPRLAAIWWLVLAAGVVLLTASLWFLLKPSTPTPRGITAAPEGVSSPQ